MKHYFLIDRLDILHSHVVHYAKCEYVAQDHHSVPEDHEPVIAWVSFTSIGSYHTFTSRPGVHELPDPIDNEPLEHKHMQRLRRVHKHHSRTDEHGNTTWHDHTGKQVEHPTTRKLMNQLAKEHWPSFKFKIF